MEKILVVEDDHAICDLTQIILEREGYQVDTAANGQLALEMFGKVKPDLVVSDIGMPEMDGFTA